MDLSDFFTLAGWGLFVATTWGLFSRAEEVVAPSVKEKISDWLKYSSREKGGSNWPLTFAGVFDGIFGVHPWSVSFWLKSCLFSLLWVSVLTGLWIALNPALKVFVPHFPNTPSQIIGTLKFLLTVSALFCILPDYLSLIKARAIIGYMAESHSRVSNYFLLLVDTIASLGIFLFTFFCVQWIFGLNRGEGVYTAFLKAYYYSIGLPDFFFWIQPYGAESSTRVIDPASIYLCSTLLTSVWVWLYVLSGSMIRTFRFLRKGVSVLTPVLNVEDRPLKSLGLIAICFITILYWAVALLIWIF